MAGPYTPFQAVIDYIRPEVDAFARRVNGNVVVHSDQMSPSLEVAGMSARQGRGSVYIAVNPLWAPNTVAFATAVSTKYGMSAQNPKGNIPLSSVEQLDLAELVTKLNRLGKI